MWGLCSFFRPSSKLLLSTMGGQDTALFVLRTILRRRREAIIPLRNLTSLAVPYDPLQLSSNSAESSTPLSSEFVEPRTSEYTSTLSALPPRQRRITVSWPTLLPPPPTEQRLLSLIEAENYQTALQVLTSLDKPVKPRKVYLPAAMHAITHGDWPTALVWLDLYPNRPAASAKPDLQAMFHPFVQTVLRDPEWTEPFLLIAGKKGFLPHVLEALLHPLARYPARTDTLRLAIDAYLTDTISRHSQSDRAKRLSALAQYQAARWWYYFFRLMRADEAMELFERPPRGLTWEVDFESLRARTEKGWRRGEEPRVRFEWEWGPSRGQDDAVFESSEDWVSEKRSEWVTKSPRMLPEKLDTAYRETTSRLQARDTIDA